MRVSRVALGSAAPLEYCTSLVKRLAHDDYLMGLLLPGATQRHCFFATRALNLELASVVNDTKMRQDTASARLQWWKSAVSDMYRAPTQAPPAHPVLQALHGPISSKLLSRAFVVRLVEVRLEEVTRGSRPFRSINELEQFGERCYGTLNYLHLESASIRDNHADHAASHLGKAFYFVTILRGVPHLAQQRRCLLPVDVMAQYSLSQEALYSGESSPALLDVCHKLASQGRDHLLHADTIATPKAAVVLALSKVSLSRFFERFERVQFDPYKMASTKDHLLAYHLWRRS